MNVFIMLLSIMLGIAAGIGATYIYLQREMKKILEQVKSDTARMQADFESDRKNATEQLEVVREKMQAVRDEARQYWDKLQDEIKRRESAEEMAGRIPALEGSLVNKDTHIRQLQDEKQSLLERIDRLQEEMKEQQESFQKSLVFVHGNHYLPGSVVKHLTRKESEGDQENGISEVPEE